MMHAPFEIFGSPSWVRTSDLRINSPSLYRLSYRGILEHLAVQFKFCLGSPSWVRTSDLRINSPSLYRLSYRGIKTANFTEARLECQIFKIIQMLLNVKSEKSNC